MHLSMQHDFILSSDLQIAAGHRLYAAQVDKIEGHVATQWQHRLLAKVFVAMQLQVSRRAESRTERFVQRIQRTRHELVVGQVFSHWLRAQQQLQAERQEQQHQEALAAAEKGGHGGAPGRRKSRRQRLGGGSERADAFLDAVVASQPHPGEPAPYLDQAVHDARVMLDGAALLDHSLARRGLDSVACESVGTLGLALHFQHDRGQEDAETPLLCALRAARLEADRELSSNIDHELSQLLEEEEGGRAPQPQEQPSK